jgi:hypothetical protein
MPRVLLAAILLLIFVPSVVAAPVQPVGPVRADVQLLSDQCWRIWEDANATGDSAGHCGSVADFSVWPHSQAGQCNGPWYKFDDSWNDCASSIAVNLQSHYCLDLYQNANYSVRFAWFQGPTGVIALRYNTPSPWNDTLSSVRVRTC